jgi:hypothetical protein
MDRQRAGGKRASESKGLAVMIRRITAVALVVGTLGAAAVAEAVVTPGFYSGQTAQRADVSLRVISNRRAVITYFFEGAVLGCSNGENIQLNGFRTPRSQRFPIRNGRFGLQAQGSNGAVAAQIRGRIRSPRVTGTIRMVARMNENGELDPNGSITCDSGEVPWSARLRRR